MDYLLLIFIIFWALLMVIELKGNKAFIVAMPPLPNKKDVKWVYRFSMFFKFIILIICLYQLILGVN